MNMKKREYRDHKVSFDELAEFLQIDQEEQIFSIWIDNQLKEASFRISKV